MARLQAIAQAGLELTDGVYDRERYAALRALATEIAAAHLDLPTPDERLRLEELLAGDGGYPTPKVDVRALVRRGGEVLL
ncbi:MAG TPA: NUDIX hydrolase N-terminal domain-containing protein, partial [Actinomycetota bacterium]|nr:NUDIX hydrolase N-terminal domain-containing protein [Actinomycetota bacterium]